jgi:hypothetical protein
LKSFEIDEKSVIFNRIRKFLSTIHSRLFEKDKIFDSTDARRAVFDQKRKAKESIQEFRLNEEMSKDIFQSESNLRCHVNIYTFRCFTENLTKDRRIRSRNRENNVSNA